MRGYYHNLYCYTFLYQRVILQMGRKNKWGCKWSFAVLVTGLWLLPVLSYSQPEELRRLIITPVAPPDQGIPVFRDHPDKAALIISSSLTNLTFDSNMGGIVDQRSEPARGRYILIIESYTQIIQSNAPGFMTGRFRVAAPQARDVLYYEIEPEERTRDLIPLVFNVEPIDARLFVDGQVVETNHTVQLSPGPKQILLEREGYRVLQDVITVSMDNVLFNYRMEEIDIVPVHIQSNVPGASVLIDGTVRGEIDRAGGLGLFLYPGTYALTLINTGYVTHSENLEVSEEGVNRATVELQSNFGKLVLEVRPSDARVELNRQDYSKQALVELAPGRYRLDVQKDGYAPHSETVEIVRNERLERSITLEAYSGSLQFSVTPSNARVRLLDETGRTVESWQGINLLRGLKVGRYKLEASAPGYSVREEDIVVRRDETSRVRLELESQAVTQRTQPLMQTEPPDSEKRFIWIVSAERMLFGGADFYEKTQPSAMSGLSFAVRRSLSQVFFGRFGIGLSYDPSGQLWYPYGQTAVGIKPGNFLFEAQVSMGPFMLNDEHIDETFSHSFLHSGIGVGLDTKMGAEIMLYYAIYTEPSQNIMAGMKLAYRL